MPLTDKERLDFLQLLTSNNDNKGGVILRMSETQRGWRLHQSSRKGAVPSVRCAIDNFIKEHYPDYFLGVS